MIVFTLRVTNRTDAPLTADLLDVAYLCETDTLFIPDQKREIELTFEDVQKREFKRIGYWAFVQSLFIKERFIHAKLLAQTYDAYPARFIWYQRMNTVNKAQVAIRNLNLIMPSGEDGKHIIGQHFVINDRTMLKLYLYPQEEYYVQFEMMDPGNWEHNSEIPDGFFKS